MEPRVAVDIQYLTAAPDYDGFVDPTLSAAATRKAIADAADVVYLPAGAA